MRNPDKLPGGADICAEDGNIQWEYVKTARTQFVMVKASEGGDDTLPCSEDPMFLENVRGAYNAGLRVGAYHWFTANSIDEAKEQAAFFLKQLSQVGVMINFYCGVVITEWKDRDQAFLYADVFMGLVSAEGYRPLLYAPPEFFDDLKNLTIPIWLPCMPDAWSELPENLRNCTTLWQYRTDSLRGVEADMMRSVLLRPEELICEDYNASVIPYSKKKRTENFSEAYELLCRICP